MDFDDLVYAVLEAGLAAGPHPIELLVRQDTVDIVVDDHRVFVETGRGSFRVSWTGVPAENGRSTRVQQVPLAEVDEGVVRRMVGEAIEAGLRLWRSL